MENFSQIPRMGILGRPLPYIIPDKLGFRSCLRSGYLKGACPRFGPGDYFVSLLSRT